MNSLTTDIKLAYAKADEARAKADQLFASLYKPGDDIFWRRAGSDRVHRGEVMHGPVGCRIKVLNLESGKASWIPYHNVV